MTNYEQPLNERIRVFLRLEFLFKRIRHLNGESDIWASRSAVEALIDVLAVISRTDVKKELLKELERQAVILEALGKNPKVDHSRLQTILDDIHDNLELLRDVDTSPGYELRDDELLAAVRQRSSIPAGACDFDLPAV